MRKSNLNKTFKKKTKCIYTDEVKRIIKKTKKVRKSNKKFLKLLNQNKLFTS